ncbi:MAG TPA: ribosome maturation factor RimP [Propionibacteriaceae bacterium]|nr:ribosome maturation factor RimP [Propionibacteriaceae bacterium]
MKESSLTPLLTPILAQFALELETVDVVPAGKRRLVRIVVDGDGPKGDGPLLDDIAAATKAISAALDESDIPGASPYTLEVTSRGVSRPLTLPRHWRRNTGRLVQVTTLDGTKVAGRIGTSTEDDAALDVNGLERRIRFADVAKALIQIEMNRSVTEPEEED